MAVFRGEVLQRGNTQDRKVSRAEATPDWMKPPSTMDNIRFAALTGNFRDIEAAKSRARQEGRFMGMVATIILFNAEK